jgi:hypothetical protein
VGRAAVSIRSLVYLPKTISPIFFAGFAAVFDLKDTGRFELVAMFHQEVADVEFEAGGSLLARVRRTED